MCLNCDRGQLEIMSAWLTQVPLQRGRTLLHDVCANASEEQKKLSQLPCSIPTPGP
jgi:hypothetical protein